jgi:hypothetical protein
MIIIKLNVVQTTPGPDQGPIPPVPSISPVPLTPPVI